MKTLLKQTGLAALYGLLVFLDDRYIADSRVLVALEPASGLALAVLLIGGVRYAWGILIGAMMANMMEAPFIPAVITSIADVLEGFGAAWLLTRIGKFDAALGSLRDYLRLILFSAASVAVAGSIWCMASIAAGSIRSAEYWHEWIHWWLGDMLGIILLAPLILVWWLTKSKVPSMKRIVEAVWLFGLTLLAGQMVFFGWLHDSIGNLARGYVMFLFTVWAAARFGTRGTVAIINLIGIQALFGTLHGNGYFSNELGLAQQGNYWFYMTILSIVGMALATFLNGREQVRQELKQSKEEFERFFNLIPDMACIASTDGYFRKINPAWQVALGYAEQEILSTPFLDFIHPDDREATMNEVARQLAGGAPMRFCNRYRCKDGNYRLLEWDMIPPVDGELLYGSARDITERKLAEDALIESEHMLREAQSLTHIGHFKYAPSTQTVEGSDELFKIFGLTRDQFQFSAFLESVHPDDRALGMATIESAIERKASDKVEHRLLLRDGTLKWVKVNVKFVAVIPEEQSLLVGTIQDITERKQAEMRLRESEVRLQSIINNTSAVIFMKDTAGRYLLVNARYEKLFHISNEGIQGKTDYDLFPAEMADALVKADRKTIQLGRSIEVEEQVMHDDGIHTYISAKFPLRDVTGNIYAVCGIATDITERKAREQQLHDLAAHIVDVREEEKASIAREVHDELGGTLAALNIDAHWLMHKLSACDNASALVERTQMMAQRIDGAVNVTRRIIDNMRPALIDDLGLLAAIEWLAEDFHERTGIECRVKCIEDEANLDEQRAIALFRILQEALTNIIRHSGASRVEVEFLHSEKEAVLKVADNGCGKVENNVGNSKSYGILGMKERVKKLGGAIEFSQPRGGGFSVEVTLPLFAAEGIIKCST